MDLTKETNRNIFQLTETGEKLLKVLPILNNSQIPDVTDIWFNAHYFKEMTPLIFPSTGFRFWQEVDENVRLETCKEYLSKAFEIFRQSNVPKISLKQTFLYLCLRFGIELKLITNINDLKQWLQVPRILGSFIYEVRIAARENESYIIRRHA